MACQDSISKSIVSDCTTQGSGGNEVKGWIARREDITFTYDVTNPSMITTFTMAAGGTQLYTFTGVKKMLNSGHDLVSEAARADGFTHYVGFSGFEFKAADVENFDALDDLVFFVESKDKTDDGDGVFRVYGTKRGLVKITDNMRANDNYGARIIEMQSPEGELEAYSNYTLFSTDYATTKGLLVAAETPTV